MKETILIKKGTYCKWFNDGESYIAECGFEFCFNDDRDSVNEYEFNFCPKCGLKIKESK